MINFQGLYIDPAATSTLLIAGTSIAIAVGTAVTIAWRKAKRKLNIDDMSKKENEAEVELVDEDDDI